MAEGHGEEQGILHLFRDEPLTIPPDSDDLVNNLDQKVWDHIAELSKKSPFNFVDLTDELLGRTGKLPEKERKSYVDEAYDFCSILANYHGSEYLIRNFFGYLFDRTREMTNKNKREFVTIAKSVYDSVFTALFKKTGNNENIEKSLYGFIRPKTSLIEGLRFSRHDYDILKEEICVRRLLDNEEAEALYRKETVDEIIELIVEKREVA